MSQRLFTSPCIKAKHVKLWCRMVRENKGKVLLYELEIKSALNILTNKKTAS